MSSNYQQSDSSINESKESFTSMGDQESQDQAFSNYTTQNNQLNLLNIFCEANSNDNSKCLNVIQGKYKNEIKKNIHNNDLKKTQNKKKIKKIKEFQAKEDVKLQKLVNKYGGQFEKIVKQFPKKTVGTLKNRYYKNLKYRWEDLLGIKCIETMNDNKTDEMKKDNQPLSRQDLINMVPNTYSCPIIANMLSKFITKMDQFIKTQF